MRARMPNRQETIKITVTLEKDAYDFIVEKADELEVSHAHVVRMAIRQMRKNELQKAS